MHGSLTSGWLLMAVAAWFAAALAPCRGAAGDDDEIGVVSPVPQPEVDNWDANFDQWVFPGVTSAAAGRQRLETQVKMHLAEIDRSCQLADQQRERLQLAARGDLQRFLDQVEALRRKFEATKRDNEAMGQLWQEIQPLQVRQSRGLTGPDGLLTKILSKTLTEEQSRQFDAAQNERRRFRYEASIAVALHTLEGSVALTGEQRQQLTKLLLELPPPRIFGQYDSFLVNYRLANLPASAGLKDLFDARQWKALEQPFVQARAMRQNLIDQGYLPREDLDVTAAEVKP